MNINEGVKKTSYFVCERNKRNTQNNKRSNNVTTLQVGKRSKSKPPVIRTGHAFSSSTSTNSTNWKNCSNQTIDLNSSNRTYDHNFSESDPKIILAITEGRGEATCEIGLAAINVGQPELILCQISDIQSYTNIITKINILNPVEIIVPITMANSRLVEQIKNKFTDKKITGVSRATFNKENGMQYIKNLCAPKWNSVMLILQHRYYALTSAGALLTYLQNNLYVRYADKSIKVEYQESEKYCVIDIFTADKLELVACALNKLNEKYTSLFGVINHCQTKIGERMLRATILQPPCSVPVIQTRLDCIEELKAQPEKITSLQGILKQVSYIDQILGLGLIMPEQTQNCSSSQLNYILMLNSLFDSLEPLAEILDDLIHPIFVDLKSTLTNEGFTYLKNVLRMIVHENARPAKGQEGVTQRCFAIKEGVNEILDVVRNNYSKRLNEMQEYVKSLSETYNLDLKLANNNKKGYHIVMQLSIHQRKTFDKSNLPEEFIQIERLTTMVTMKTIKILTFSHRLDDLVVEILKISNIIIYSFLNEVRERIEIFYKLCEDIAKLDMLQSLAYVCSSNKTYTRPKFGEILEVIDSRHPMLDFLCTKEPISNDINASKWFNLNIITGPNGSGKSIYIRQIVLLQVMAQIGCFVPATSANFRVADRILARIYFEDNINCGASTFMVEMQEIKYFLNVMTKNTLIIIDELCRSTSVEEGAALSMALCEHFSSTSAFVFFSTHYTLVTNLQKLGLNIKCWQLEAIENENNDFLKLTHKLLPGVTSLTGYAIGLAKACWRSEAIDGVNNILEMVKDSDKSDDTTPRIDPRLRLKYDLEFEMEILKCNNQLTEDIVRAKLEKYFEDLQNCTSDFDSYICPEIVYSNNSKSSIVQSTNDISVHKNESFGKQQNVAEESYHSLSNVSKHVNTQSDENNYTKQSNYKEVDVVSNTNVSAPIIYQITENFCHENYNNTNLCENEHVYDTNTENMNIENDAINSQEYEEQLSNMENSNYYIPKNQTFLNLNNSPPAVNEIDIFTVNQNSLNLSISRFDRINITNADEFGNTSQNLNISNTEIQREDIYNISKHMNNTGEIDGNVGMFSLEVPNENVNNTNEKTYYGKNMFSQEYNNTFQNFNKSLDENIFDFKLGHENNIFVNNADSVPQESSQIFKSQEENNFFKKPASPKLSFKNIRTSGKASPLINKTCKLPTDGNYLPNENVQGTYEYMNKNMSPQKSSQSFNENLPMIHTPTLQKEQTTLNNTMKFKKTLSELEFVLPLIQSRDKCSTPFLSNISSIIDNNITDSHEINSLNISRNQKLPYTIVSNENSVVKEPTLFSQNPVIPIHTNTQSDLEASLSKEIVECSKYFEYEMFEESIISKEIQECSKYFEDEMFEEEFKSQNKSHVKCSKLVNKNKSLEYADETLIGTENNVSKYFEDEMFEEQFKSENKSHIERSKHHIDKLESEDETLTKSKLDNNVTNMDIDENTCGEENTTIEKLAKEIEGYTKMFEDINFGKENIRNVGRKFYSEKNNTLLQCDDQNSSNKSNKRKNDTIFENSEKLCQNLSGEKIIMENQYDDDKNNLNHEYWDLKESTSENISDISGNSSINYSPNYELLNNNSFCIESPPDVHEDVEEMLEINKKNENPNNTSHSEYSYKKVPRLCESSNSNKAFKTSTSSKTTKNSSSKQNTSDIIEKHQKTPQSTTSSETPMKPPHKKTNLFESSNLSIDLNLSHEETTGSYKKVPPLSENSISNKTNYSNNTQQDISQLSLPEFKTSTSSKTTINGSSKGNTSDIIEKHQKTIQSTTSSETLMKAPHKKTNLFESSNLSIDLNLSHEKRTGSYRKVHPLSENSNSNKTNYSNMQQDISQLSSPVFQTSTSSKTTINGSSKGNTSDIIEKHQKTIQSTTSSETLVKAPHKKTNLFQSSNLSIDPNLSTESTSKKFKFKPPLRTSSSDSTVTIPKPKDYMKAILERDIANINLTGEKCQQYVNEMLNRPSVRQIRGMKTIVTAHKTKDGSIIIQPNLEKKKFKQKKFKPPLRNAEYCGKFDATIFSDQNVDMYNKFIKSNCDFGTDTTSYFNRSSSDCKIFNRFGSSSSSSNAVKNTSQMFPTNSGLN